MASQGGEWVRMSDLERQLEVAREGRLTKLMMDGAWLVVERTSIQPLMARLGEVLKAASGTLEVLTVGLFANSARCRCPFRSPSCVWLASHTATPSRTDRPKARSNVTGQIFFEGREFVVENPEADHVSVESFAGSAVQGGEPIVRDDSPPLVHPTDARLHYVRTYVTPQGTFMRSYVVCNWLSRLRLVSVRSTKITGHGLTALAAAAGATLSGLDASDCDQLDDTGMHGIVRFCKALKTLRLQNCPKLTKHGIMHLAELEPACATLLQELDLGSNPQAFPSSIMRALRRLLEAGGFGGKISDSEGRLTQAESRVTGEPNQLTEVARRYSDQPGKLWNVNLADISQQCLRQVRGAAGEPLLAPGGEPAVEVILDDQLVTNDVLLQVCRQFGPRVFALRISGTFVTERGLGYLVHCPNVQVLHLARLWNVLDKQVANQALAPAVRKMLNLTTLDISDSRISGRVLSDHPTLRLRYFNGSRSPVSAYAVRTLMETSAKTMGTLLLSGCRFLNTRAVQMILQFERLSRLDISHCLGLSNEDLVLFQRMPSLAARHMQVLDISGIPGVNQELADRISAGIQRQAGPGSPRPEVVWNGVASAASAFRGQGDMEDCVYGVPNPAGGPQSWLSSPSLPRPTRAATEQLVSHRVAGPAAPGAGSATWGHGAWSPPPGPPPGFMMSRHLSVGNESYKRLDDRDAEGGFRKSPAGSGDFSAPPPGPAGAFSDAYSSLQGQDVDRSNARPPKVAEPAGDEPAAARDRDGRDGPGGDDRGEDGSSSGPGATDNDDTGPS